MNSTGMANPRPALKSFAARVIYQIFTKKKIIFAPIEYSKHIDSIKYAQEIRKLIAAFESRFTNLDKYKTIFEIYSSPLNTYVNLALEYLQMEFIDLQCNNESKHIFEISKSKIDLYNINITKEKFPNLRNRAQKVVSAFGSTYTCE
ncbi:unnamed protein product [Macrosiphum euphorbiae]|uniref:Uncharacterized protein n=1 Tax=Macrosiphum euphorbiae TaxID=13131 RepID=A0AAV0VML7_9HEMI|nr:unnamed protein product [Macrosiphum euphorbiae]